MFYSDKHGIKDFQVWGTLWKELSHEDQTKYNDAAKKRNSVPIKDRSPEEKILIQNKLIKRLSNLVKTLNGNPN